MYMGITINIQPCAKHCGNWVCFNFVYSAQNIIFYMNKFIVSLVFSGNLWECGGGVVCFSAAEEG